MKDSISFWLGKVVADLVTAGILVALMGLVYGTYCLGQWWKSRKYWRHP